MSTMREQFEAWAAEEGYPESSFEISNDGDVRTYYDTTTEAMWDSWQAATEAAKATGTAGEQKPRAWIIEDKEGGEPCFTEYSTEHVGGEPLYKHTLMKPNLSLLQRYAFDGSENGPYVWFEDVASLLENESQPDVTDLRNMLRSLQNYEMSVSRAQELVEAWLAGNYSDDMLPEREPDKLEQIEKLKAEAARQPAPVVDVKPEDITIESWDRHPRGGMQVGMPLGVKLTHKPTATVICVDSNRSQHRNKALSMEGLRAILAATNRSQP